MSVSERKKNANRRNANKSTGPKTASGKRTSSRNGVIHGAYSSDLIIRSPYLNEDPAEYERLLASITAELQPETLFQQALVTKIANCLWRSRRVIAAETANIEHAHSRVRDTVETICRVNPFVAEGHNMEIPEPDYEREEEMTRRIAVRKTIPDKETARHLLYYEMRLDRQLSRTYRLYRQLKRSARIDQAIAASNSHSADSPAPASPDPANAADTPTPTNPTDSASRPTILSTPSEDANMGSPLFDIANPPVDCPPTT